MIGRIKLLNALLFLMILGISACTSPRNIVSSGKVTPKGTFKGGFNSSFNISTAPLAEIDDITLAAVKAIDNHKDSIFYDETVAALAKGLMAYSLDPVTPTSDFYIRYGVASRLDAGYKFASGAHVFDVMYQFLGTTGTPDAPETGHRMHGSIGFQYSGQKSDLPSKVGLDKLSKIFSYELSRKDLLIPLVFSVPFGPEETYGNFSFGLVYGHSSIKYGFNPTKTLVRYVGSQFVKIPEGTFKESYSSFGGFLNGKIGYKYVYFVPALSVYYQNYGDYDLFGFQQESFKGFTIIPSLGVQFNLAYNRKKQTKDF